MRQNANGASRLKNTARTTRACSRAQEGQMTAARTKQNGKQRKRHRKKKREVNLQQDKKKYYLVYIKMYRYVCMILKAAIVAYIASRLLCTRYRVYVSPAERIVTRLVVGRDATEATAGPGRREGPRSAGKRAQPAEQAAAGMPMARPKATRSIKKRSTYTRTRVTVHKTIATKLCKEKVGKRNFTAAFRTVLPFYSEICTGIQCSVFTYAGRDERGDNCSIQYSSI